jgi:hypothetical protein
MEQEGLIAAREISKWWVEANAAMPAPRKKEIVMLKSHIDRGLSLPPSYFFKSMLRHYELQLHHIAPNSLTIIAGLVALCEGYLGVYLCSACTSTSATTGNQMEILTTADISLLSLVAERRIHILSHMTPPGDGEEPSSTKLTKRLPKRSTD